MFFRKAIFIGLSTFLFISLFISCGVLTKLSEQEILEATGTTIDPKIKGLMNKLATLKDPNGIKTEAPKPMVDTELDENMGSPKEEQVTENGIPVTYITTLKKFKASASFDTQVLLNPGTDVIYPGSVILGHTIDDGSYVEVTRGIKRPVTISYDLTGVKNSNGNPGKVSGTIVPALDGFRNLHNEITNQQIPNQSTIYSYEQTEIKDESEFDLKFSAGAGFKSPAVTVSVKAGFNFNKGNKKNKFMIKFMQTFYTVDVSQGAGTFLYEDFDLADFKGFRPVYVSSIAYGRLAYLTIESEKSWTNINANLNILVDTAAYGTYDASFDASVKFLKENTTLNITVIGADTVATGVEAFVDFLKNGGFSSTNPGKIISYKLRFVDDNTIANTIFNGEYTMRTTEVKMGGGVRVGLKAYSLNNQTTDGSGPNCEFYGNLDWKKSDNTQISSLWAYADGSGLTFDIPEKEISIIYYKGRGVLNNWSYHTFNSTNNSFNIVLSGMGEDDGSSGDEKYEDKNENFFISNLLNNGKTGSFKIKSFWVDNGKIKSEFVEFTILYSVEVLY